MESVLERWMKGIGKRCLKKIGIRKGQIILDFGCGSGNYTIPAAEIVGETGKVYALDKEKLRFLTSEGLDKLIRRTASLEIENIGVIKTSGELDIDLEDESVDVVLRYDVLHYYYFPMKKDRMMLLEEVYRIIKLDGFLSFYPGDPEVSQDSFQLEIIKKR